MGMSKSIKDGKELEGANLTVASKMAEKEEIGVELHDSSLERDLSGSVGKDKSLVVEKSKSIVEKLEESRNLSPKEENDMSRNEE